MAAAYESSVRSSGDWDRLHIWSCTSGVITYTVAELQQQRTLVVGQIHHGFGELSLGKAPAKVGQEEMVGAAGCHLPGRSLPCLHQHDAG